MEVDSCKWINRSNFGIPVCVFIYLVQAPEFDAPYIAHDVTEIWPSLKLSANHYFLAIATQSHCRQVQNFFKKEVQELIDWVNHIFK